jgi:HSP20 family protein
MPEVDVKKNQKEEKSITRRGGSELASRGTWEPFSWWRTPSEFFSDPFSVMRRFREEMDRAFSRSFGEEFGSGEMWSPAIEVTEQNGALQVHAELPGLRPEDVKIEATDDSLIIQGERKYEHEENKQVSSDPSAATGSSIARSRFPRALMSIRPRHSSTTACLKYHYRFQSGRVTGGKF